MIEVLKTEAPIPSQDAENATGLYLVALFVVAVVAFLAHFNLLAAPLQGIDFDLFFFDDAFHRPGTAFAAQDRMPGAPLSVFGLAAAWQIGGIAAVRAVGLLLFVMSVLLLFQLIRQWLGRPSSMVAPLLGGLLLAVSPVVAQVVADSAGWPALLGLCCALASGVLFLRATENPEKPDPLALAAALWMLAAAVAAHHSLVMLPAALLLLDATRLDRVQRPRLRPAWFAHGVVIALAATCAAIVRVSGGVMPVLPPAPGYGLSILIALIAAWPLAAIRIAAFRYGVVGLCLLVLPVGAVLSFQRSAAWIDVTGRLEQMAGQSGISGLYRRLALQYIEAAERAEAPSDQAALLQEAAAAWSLALEKEQVPPAEGILFGNTLHRLGLHEEAVTVLQHVFEEAPFAATGIEAALNSARVLDESTDAARMAELFAFVYRNTGLTADDSRRYARVLMQTGDILRAAALYAFVPELEEDSPEAFLKAQAAAARNASLALQQQARARLSESPTSAEGFVATAESNLIRGDMLSAFYWLDMVLRRDEAVERAWNLLGVLFVRQNQADHFIEHWGAIKAADDEAWISLSRQAAQMQNWDAALAFARQYSTDEAPAAEEFMAAFALEMQRLAPAEEWLVRATEARPDLYRPWIGLFEIALAQGNNEKAGRMLEEARRRNAPQAELESREARLAGTEPAPSPETAPFEPIRTYIR